MKRGFSYVEVMLSGVALSIFLVPVLATFYQAMNNQRFAIIHYQGALNAQSVLLKISNVIHDRFEHLEYYFQNITSQHDTDVYSYTLYISPLHPNVSLFLYRYFYTHPIHVQENIFDYFSHEIPTSLQNFGTHLMDMNNPTYIEGVTVTSNAIYFSSYIQSGFSISILNIPPENEFHIHNLSYHQIFVTILDSYCSELSNLHLHTEFKGIVLTHAEPIVNYFVVFHVHSVETGRLIKSFVRIL